MADSFDAMPPDVERRLSVWLTLGKELNPHTINLVVRFARALAAKLADAEKKYGYGDGWLSRGWMDECRVKLLEHIAKGDPRDVAAYCAFLWHHKESTSDVVWIQGEQYRLQLVPVEDAAPGVSAAAETQIDRLRGQFGVAVALLNECIGPLEVSAAVIDGDFDSAAMETLIGRLKQFAKDAAQS